MSEPKVSVIVLTYNQEKWIGRALDSVLSQSTDFDYEVIVCDDCSTDGTADVCRRYAARFPDKIRFVANVSNKGLARNYFDAVKLARGEYIADCAGDDAWYGTERLQLLVDALECAPESAMVHSAWRYYDAVSGETTEPTSSTGRVPGRDEVNDGVSTVVELLNGAARPMPVIHLSASVYRRSVLMDAMERHGSLYTGDWLLEDLQVIAAMGMWGPIRYVDRVTLLYTRGNATISSMEDYAKTARFHQDAARMSMAIARQMNIRRECIAGYMNELAAYIMANVFYARRGDMRREFLRFIGREGLRLPFKSRILRLLSSNALLWRLSLALRKGR